MAKKPINKRVEEIARCIGIRIGCPEIKRLLLGEDMSTTEKRLERESTIRGCMRIFSESEPGSVIEFCSVTKALSLARIPGDILIIWKPCLGTSFQGQIIRRLDELLEREDSGK